MDAQGLGVFDFQKFVDLIYQFRRKPVTEVELQETFRLLDLDGSGSIDAAELRQLLTCVGHGLSMEEAEAMVEEADKDCSGEVEYDEFSHMVLSTQ